MKAYQELGRERGKGVLDMEEQIQGQRNLSMSTNCRAIELHKKLQRNLIQVIAENAQKCKEMRNESNFRILRAKLRNLKSSAE